ncbi:MAG: alkaline phosphatase family protein [Acidobacteriia bacterium]|nr:alkaline phosphatase family protein [Terriglobia bacterium]
MLVSRRFFAALAAGGAASIRSLVAARSHPKLMVLLIAEEFRSDYLDLFGNFLGPGGFRRLMDDGAYFPECQIAATTFTSTSLATTSTGAYPQLHGIVADTWYDRATKKRVAAMPEALEATTVAEQLAAADSANRVYAVAFDSRDAAILSGAAPASLFYLDATGHFGARGPSGDAPWITAYSQANAAEIFRHAQWRALGAKKEAPPLRTLTYDQARPEEFLALYKASPFGQAAQMALAREILTQEKVGQGPGTDLLMVALGSGALLGYELGGDSPLMRELVLRLDHEVELLLALLDKNLGARNYALVFTSAHGATRDPDGKRATLAVPGDAVAKTINQALSAHYDTGGRKKAFVERYIYPFLYLRQDVLQKSYIDLREARVLAGQAALTVPGVTGYYTADGDTSHPGDWARRFSNSFHPVRSGDVMLAYGPEHVEDYGAGRGISYGSLYNYDTRVPLILYGAPFENAVFETAVELVDLAPTLARVAGMAWPSSSTGRVLGEALAAEG